MSYEDGWAAVNLGMPPRVPRFEPSAGEYHWELVKTVTGIDVNVDSPQEIKRQARQAFLKAWDYGIDFRCTGVPELQKKRSHMGHAEYAQYGRDFDRNIHCPFKTAQEALALDPFETYGEVNEDEVVQRINEQYANACRAYPDLVNMSGVYVTQMSGMIAILGWEMLLTAAGVDAKGFGDLVNRYARWIQTYYNAVARSDTTVVYSHDDLVWTEGPFLPPDWYRTYIFPNLKRLWGPLVEAGKKIMFVCDGNYTEFLDDVAACGNAGFWFECFTDFRTVVEKFGKTHFIIGNVDVRPLTFGTKKDVETEVHRCMDLGKSCPGYFLCCSGHIPPNVPVENALYYNELYLKLRNR
ncbi:MAG: uroporphyrinogen decarboxylase family protein [Planctomycetota bacterium]|jgi:hypothetical protein